MGSAEGHLGARKRLTGLRIQLVAVFMLFSGLR